MGGDFSRADGILVNFIACWNGTSWSALGAGVNYDVRALAVYNNALYAGGEFSMAGGASADRIARWDGMSW